MRNRTLAIALTAVAAVGLAAGAFAASQSGGATQQAFINDVARRLHVSPRQLENAFKQAEIDRINAALRAGRLTPAMAAAIKQRMARGQGIPFGPGPAGPAGPPGPWLHSGPPGAWPHPGPPGRWQRPRFFAPGMFGHPAIASSAASYLGLTEQQLFKELVAGKSLAQIGRSRGKTASGVERALTSALSSRLHRAVKDGRLTRATEHQILATLSRHLSMIINLRAPWHGLPGARRIPFRGNAGFAPPGGPPGVPPPATAGGRS